MPDDGNRRLSRGAEGLRVRATASVPGRPRVLVTGAGGQLGRAFEELLPEAVLLSRRELDVTDAEAVRETVRRSRARIVVHTAAWTAVDAAERHPRDAWRVNVDGTRAVADASARVDALLVYLSTDYVFHGRARRPYTERHRPRPASVYGMTKLRGEEAVRRCRRHLIVRTSWLFGQGRNFVLTILSAARDRKELQVVSNQTGLPTYAPDLAAGILRLVERGAEGTFHLSGGGEPCSWADLADAALEAASAASLLRSRPVVQRVTTAEYALGAAKPLAPRPAFSVLDCSKAKRHGVELRPWQEGLREYATGLAAAAGTGPALRAGGAR